MPVEIVDRGLHGLILYHRPVGDLARLTGKDPVPMLCAGTRYLVEHQLHWLADQGFRNLRLALDDRSKATESLVGDGARWGCQVSYAFDAQNLTLVARLRKHRAFVGEGMLLLEGNAMVQATLPEDLAETTFFTDGDRVLPMMFCSGDDWSRLIEACTTHGLTSVSDVCEWGIEHLSGRRVALAALAFALDTLQEFIDMNREILRHPDPFHIRGTVVQDGVRLGRRAAALKSVAFEGPVIVGDDAVIKADTTIGPNVFIGHNSYVERGARIVDSVIAPSTYVGRNTSFEGKYVCRNYVVDLSTRLGIFVDDPLILGDLTRSAGLVETVERLWAFIMLVVVSPLIVLLMPLHRLFRGAWVVTERILVQPVARNFKSGYDFQYTYWRRFNFGLFALDFLPGLLDIVTGKVKFVGNPPLSEADVAALDGLFMGDQLRGKAGLTGPVQQLDTESASPDEVFATTIYYNATQSIRGDIFLFLHALVPGVHRFKRTTAYGSRDS